MKAIINRVLKVFYFYIALIGMFGFACFIMEESIQMLTFSMFTIKDSQRWDIGLSNIEKMEEINNHLEIVNGLFMWLQPIQMYAYNDFIEATRGYIESQRGLILAQAPELFIGQELSLNFYYREMRRSYDYYELSAGKIRVFIEGEPKGNPVHVEGVLRRINHVSFEIDTKQIGEYREWSY